MSRNASSITLIIASVALGGCSSAPPPEPAPAKAPDAKPAGQLVKTLELEKNETWKLEKSGGMVRARYEAPAAEGDREGAEIFVLHVGPDDTFEKELAFWASHSVDKDGKKFDPSAIAQGGFEAGGFAIKTGELSGIAPKAHKPKRAGDEKKDEKSDATVPAAAPTEVKANHKLLACYIEGPDGAWVVKLTGAERSFDKARDDFLKFVKTVRVVERPAEEMKPRREGRDRD